MIRKHWPLLAAAAPWLVPLQNPDAFWHLAAGRWIVERRAVPRADSFSFTRFGQEWIDFEWLAQLVFFGAERLGGNLGLWTLKVGLLAAAAAVLDGILRSYRVQAPARALALGLWSCSMIPFSDLRPELFSIIFLLVLVSRLERLTPGWAFGLFALWANTHAGFVIGLALLGAAGKWRLPAAAAAGTLVNPYFLGPYQVLWRHMMERPDLSLIGEWQALSPRNSFHWAFWPLLGAVLVRLARRGRAALNGPAVLTAALGLASLAHARLACYFSALAVPLLAPAFPAVAGRRLALAAAACAAYLVFVGRQIPWDRLYSDRHVPRLAAEFMASEPAVFSGLRVHNHWEWGGYLAWRLHPWHKVSIDGRYLFHPDLPAQVAAYGSPKLWRERLDAHDAGAALVPNLPILLPGERFYPDGSSRRILRPWYVSYLPKDQWALVHWDDQSLLFLARGRAPAGWLAEREYRYWRPRDDAARQDALARGEIPESALEGEAKRHAAALAALDQRSSSR